MALKINRPIKENIESFDKPQNSKLSKKDFDAISFGNWGYSKSSIDYIKLYAINLNKNPRLFVQQKKLIESQIKSSRELFKKKFGRGKEFKINAREYLRNIGIL